MLSHRSLRKTFSGFLFHSLDWNRYFNSQKHNQIFVKFVFILLMMKLARNGGFQIYPRKWPWFVLSAEPYMCNQKIWSCCDVLKGQAKTIVSRRRWRKDICIRSSEAKILWSHNPWNETMGSLGMFWTFEREKVANTKFRSTFVSIRNTRHTVTVES